MTTEELFMKRWESEQAAFVKVIRAVPDGHHSYRPHERSSAAGALAWQLAQEQRGLVELLERGEFNWTDSAPPATTAEIVAAWETATSALREKLALLTEEKADCPGNFLMGGVSVWTEPVGMMLWGFLFDMVHHRGQLSAYLRPMGAKVPSIYGPSADDHGA